MEPTKSKVPTEAVELYNLFIHGQMSRRAFMDGIQRLAVGGLAASAMVEALMPNYALGQQVSRTDDRMKASYETVPSPEGNGSIKGYFVRPVSADTRNATPTKLPGILVIHENRGLNPHIEDIARRLALANFMAFAPDGLTSLGGFPGDDYQGGLLFNKIDKKKMFEDMVAAALWLKARPDCTGKIGVTGFCYGGSVSNSWPRGWEPTCRRRCRSTAALPRRQTFPRSRRRSWSSTGNSTSDGSHVARVRQGPDGGQCSARRLYLPQRRSRLQLRRNARTLQQGRRRSGLGAHDRLVQQIRARLKLEQAKPGAHFFHVIERSISMKSQVNAMSLSISAVVLLMTVMVGAQSLSNEMLVKALQHGGYVIVMRHASSPRETPSAETANAENTNHERQLDEAGRSSAIAMGKALHELNIPVGAVFTSPTYRALETVRLAQLPAPQTVAELGDGGQSMQASNDAQSAWLQKKITELPKGTNTIVVTHFPNMSRAFPQSTSGLADGEALVFGSDGKGRTTLIARVKIEEWPKLRP